MTNVYNNVPYLFYYGSNPQKLHPTYTAIPMVRGGGAATGTIQFMYIVKPDSSGTRTRYLFESAGIWDPTRTQEFRVNFRTLATIVPKVTMAYNLAYNETTSVYTPVNCSNVSNISYPTTTALHVNPIKPIKTLLKNIYSSTTANIVSGAAIPSSSLNLLDSSSRKQFGKNCILYYKDIPNPSINNGVYATGDILIVGISGSFEVPLVLNANPVFMQGTGFRYWSSTIDLSPFDSLTYFNLSSVAVTVIYIGIATGNAGCY
jgi:hypothetical protein